MLDTQYHEELRALRNLERTVRAYGVSAAILPQARRTQMLANALREVVEARKESLRKSKETPAP